MERDSIVVADGLPRLKNERYAGASDGRFIFALGNQRISSLATGYAAHDTGDNVTEDVAVTFDIDVIDMFLSQRTRIYGIGDLYGFGKRSGFYSLDEHNLVLVDYNSVEGIFRQNLIRIDMKRKTADCLIYRAYAMQLDTDRCATTVGEKLGVVVGSSLLGFTFPANPLCSTPHRDVSRLLDEASDYGDVNGLWIKDYAPFVMDDRKMGYLVQKDSDTGSEILLTSVLVLDIDTGTVHLRPITSRGKDSLMLTKFLHWKQMNEREIALLASTDGATFDLGTLCLLTNEWKDFRGPMEPKVINDEWYLRERRIVSVPYGSHFVLMKLVFEMGESRVIGNRAEENDEWEGNRYQLFRHPRCVDSLVRLASIALQKSERASSEMLQQIDKIINDYRP